MFKSLYETFKKATIDPSKVYDGNNDEQKSNWCVGKW